MSTTLARPLSTQAAPRPRAHSSPKRPTRTTSSVKQLYRSAGKAFVLRDFESTGVLLDQAFRASEALAKESSEGWLQRLMSGEEEEEESEEVRRKLEILRITFFATVRGSSADASSLFASTPRSIAQVLELETDKMLELLWEEQSGEKGVGISTSVGGGKVHPSIVIALVLAALKMNAPRSARSIAEAWFEASNGEEIDTLLFDTARSSLVDLAVDFTIEESSMSNSVVILPGGQTKVGRAKLLGSWMRLMDLLTLFVLPKLGEWEAAQDFVRAQGVENGGWVPEPRIEVALERLELLQRQEAEQIDAQIQRTREQEILRVEKAKEKERDRRRAEKGKGRLLPKETPILPTVTATIIPPLQSQQMVNTSPASSFTSLRTTLSTYLGRSSSLDTTAAPALSFRQLITSIASPKVIISYLHQQATLDPLRFISLLFTLFAFSSWLRTKLSGGLLSGSGRGGSQPKLIEGRGGMRNMFGFVLGKVGETLKMGTKITSL